MNDGLLKRQARHAEILGLKVDVNEWAVSLRQRRKNGPRVGRRRRH